MSHLSEAGSSSITRVLFYHPDGCLSGPVKEVKAVLAEDSSGNGMVRVDVHLDPDQADVAQFIQSRICKNLTILDPPLPTGHGFTVGIKKPTKTRTAPECPVQRLGEGVINMAHSALERKGHTVFTAPAETPSATAAD